MENFKYMLERWAYSGGNFFYASLSGGIGVMFLGLVLIVKSKSFIGKGLGAIIIALSGLFIYNVLGRGI